MRTLIHQIPGVVAPERLARQLRGQPGLGLFHCGGPPATLPDTWLLVAKPFLLFRCWGSRCQVNAGHTGWVQFGNPWQVLERLMARYELLEEPEGPFPLGGAFGYWGYDLKNFLEPRLPRRAVNDLELPDCQLGFYDSLVAGNPALGQTWIIATGLGLDGDRSASRARQALDWWRRMVEACLEPGEQPGASLAAVLPGHQAEGARTTARWQAHVSWPAQVESNFSEPAFVDAVRRAQAYIRQGHIYQVNLAQRLAAPWPLGGWALYERLAGASPAPFAAYLDCGSWQLGGSSPELFLAMRGSRIVTRPIKGTRPRGADPAQDGLLSQELLASAKERAELVMITDLLRNDLGRVCEYGSVQVPDLMRLERYAQVQHLVSTVQGQLRPGVTHLEALQACFPGGSVTGAPKIRAMEIIDELEPTARGPYTGALGYLGFNRHSQLSIIIRTAFCLDQTAYFHVGAGIVADSVPEAEYQETLSKAAGFMAALACEAQKPQPAPAH